MTSSEELRLMTKVSRLYYLHGKDQKKIAAQLDLSQSTVSRLLKRAQKEKIVRITVGAPHDTFIELEESLQEAYDLKEAVVVDCRVGDDEMLRDLGAAAAYYLENTIRRGEIIGISSWSATLLATVDEMHPQPAPRASTVVQILGGVGNPAASEHANHLTTRLATLVRAQPKFLPAPGVVGNAAAAQVLRKDRYVAEALSMFERVTVALVGIGALEPSRLLASSGNVFSREELETLRRHGAVGDICLRFFDAHGEQVRTPLDERVISMGLEQLRKVRRSVGIAGGVRKIAAIRGALEGHWINVLITDQCTAERLVKG